MLTVNWRPQAIADLIDIVDYIEQDNPQAAQRMESLIRTAALDLSVMPYIGRPGRIAGTRERLVHPNYFIVYRVGEHSVDILGVVHARRQFPPQEW